MLVNLEGKAAFLNLVFINDPFPIEIKEDGKLNVDIFLQ